jgi:hypothetical protein
MSEFRLHDYHDHVHGSGLEDNHPVLTTAFVFPGDEPPAPDNIPMPQVCSALSIIIDWVTVPENPSMAGGRAYALKLWLNPTNSRHRSLREIASRCDVSRAALSKALLSFRDEHSIGLTIGRLESSRGLFREAQLNSIEEGRHFQSQRKNANLDHSGDHKMDPKQIRERYNTLSKAVDRVLELETQLESQAKQSKPVTYTTTTTTKPAAPAPPSLSEVSTPVLMEAIDLSRRNGDRELMKKLYGELNRRRGR